MTQTQGGSAAEAPVPAAQSSGMALAAHRTMTANRESSKP